MELDFNILYFLTIGIIVGIIILSGIIVGISSKANIPKKTKYGIEYVKNYPGLYSGLVILILSSFCLLMALAGKKVIEEFSGIYFWIIGGFFLFSGIILLIAFVQKDDKDNALEPFQKIYENFSSARIQGEEKERNRNFSFGLPSGVCEKNGQFGMIVNGECITQGCDNDAYCESKEREKQKENGRNVGNEGFGLPLSFEAPRALFAEMEEVEWEKDKYVPNTAVQPIGICIMKDGNFGYTHPFFGKKCVSYDKMVKMLKEHPEYRHGAQNAEIVVNPQQSTKCYGFGRDNLLQYDLICKKEFGDTYGLKNVEGFGCPENDFRGVCNQNYQMGSEMGPDSTRCAPLGTDMNTLCQNKNLREKTSKFLKMGYKNIRFDGCPEGTQRAICDGNYFSGKKLFDDTTECFSQIYDPNRMCKEAFGNEYIAQKVISDNCVPGYIRATCMKKTK